MTLTATQLTRLRHLSGGIVGESEKDFLTDDELQAEYTAADNDFELAVVYVLRLRVGMTAAFIDRNHDLNSEQLSQRHKHLRGLLDWWEMQVGVGGSKLSTAKLDLNIDTDAEDERLSDDD